ncbi:MAG: AAA family ATPase, partial [Ramlibacter sp.]|nr:AAA family ATPase [Ramlibacter sp.]
AKSFELGERDFPARLAPVLLVGRSAGRAAIGAALDQAMTTQCRTLLIDGAAGVGKTSLIEELRPLMSASGGWFVRGRFDQYHREGEVTSGVAQAYALFGRLLLSLPAQELGTLRERLLDRLGSKAGLLARVAPEYELLMGGRAESEEVDPAHAEELVHQATIEMLTVTASAERPLVLVLDDLQWSSELSIRSFERLMADANLRGVLLVGVWCGEALAADSPLDKALPRWRALSLAPQELQIEALGEAGTTELVSQMLRLAPQRAGDLGRAVARLAGGNPFETVELVNALRKESVIGLGREGWEWDDKAVAHFVGRSQVADLLAARVSRLPPPSRRVLEVLACLGTEASSALLARATGLAGFRDDQEAAHLLHEQLRAALEDGLVTLGQTGERIAVRWRHNRVQQAVLARMDATSLVATHLQIGQQLAPASEAGTAPGGGFLSEAAGQYLACISLLEGTPQARYVAELLSMQARKFASRVMYLLADQYFEAAGALLHSVASHDPEGHAAADASMNHAIVTGRHAALYSLGRLQEADPFYALLIASLADPVDLVESTCLQMRSLDLRGDMQGSMALGLALLARFGLHAPADSAAPDVEARLDALDDWITRDSLVTPANRPQISDPRILAIVKLLGRTVRSALVCQEQDVMAWMLLESQRLWEVHGTCAELVASLGRMANLLINRRQDYQVAWRIARHVVSVGEALGYEPQTSEARFVYATYACHWFEPLEETRRHAALAWDSLRAKGDIAYAPFVHIVLITTWCEIAATAQLIERQLEVGLDLCVRTKNMAALPHMLTRQMLRALCAQTPSHDSFDDAGFDEEAFMGRWGHLPFVWHSHAVCRSNHALLMGNRKRLSQSTAGAIGDLRNLAGYYLTVHFQFFTAMARAWELQAARNGNSDPGATFSHDQVLSELDASLDWLTARAADQYGNFMHLVRLVRAERAWGLGDLWQAATEFDAAQRDVERTNRPLNRALIAERAGRFQIAQGMDYAGQAQLSKARDGYEAWGAKAKVAQMEAEHEFLRGSGEPPVGVAGSGQVVEAVGRGSGTVSSESLDLIGVLRASQALSSETGLAQLAARVTEVVASLSGATNVQVLSWHADQWWLLAPDPVQPALPVAEAAARSLVPLSAFAYVERTGEALVVDDVLRDDRFLRDAYFYGVPLCSLMVAPIRGQGAVRAMLILENRQSRAAFNAQRLDAVMLIAGQLAVSLANAQLYEELEGRVRARTLALEQAQAQLVKTARRAGRAEIANNVLHNVGNAFNSITVSASMLRGSIVNSRIEGLWRAIDMANDGELAQFMRGHPRADAFRFYLNELGEVLRSEQGEALDNLDRLARSVEHIDHVLATQQSHSGVSRVLEDAVP